MNVMNTVGFQARLRLAIDAAIADRRYASDAEVARKIGMTRSALSQLITGSSKSMKPEHLLRAAVALGVRTEWLVFGQEPMSNYKYRKEETELIEYFRRLPAEKHATALAVVRDMA